MSEIIRKPIKIRKPIFKEYCSCYPVQVISVEGTPHAMVANNLSDGQLKGIISEKSLLTNMYFSGYSDGYESKVRMCLDHKLPVTIKTSSVVPTEFLEKMREVPHCAIHVNLNALSFKYRELLEENPSSLENLRKMMYLAKAWRIALVLHIDYYPHLIPKFDLYELIEMNKGYTRHVIVTFKSMSSNVLPGGNEGNILEDIYDQSGDRVYVKESYKEEFLEEFSSFLSTKKLSGEIMEEFEGDRIRHVTSGINGSVLGLRPFRYKKDGETFVETTSTQEDECPHCGKTLLF